MQRYDISIQQPWNTTATEHGDWVKAAEAQAEIARLQAEVANLPTHIRALLADTLDYLSATLREEITEVSDAEYIIARARAALANGKE